MKTYILCNKKKNEVREGEINNRSEGVIEMKSNPNMCPESQPKIKNKSRK